MNGMNRQTISACLRDFGERYLRRDVLDEYPEAPLLVDYIRAHLADARVLLDLGFGTGLWFYASFFPLLERIDGFDLYPQNLEFADRILHLAEPPEGYRVAHARLGESFGRDQLCTLARKRGRLVIQDYRAPWPQEIATSSYDLVTEHGGGLAELHSEQEVAAVVQKCASVLRPGGCMLFANFLMVRPGDWEKRLDTPAPRELCADTYLHAVESAGMKMVDWNVLERPTALPGVKTFFYGYATRPA